MLTFMQLDPAKSVIEKFGGPAAVAAITGRHVTRVYRWMRAREDGGTGGLIPNKEALKLLAAAPDKGVDLTPADLFDMPEQEPAQ
jgi:hypothetical protein